MYTRPLVEVMATPESVVGWKVSAAWVGKVGREFLHGWQNSRETEIRRGKKGQKYVY
jgi:hypothetical protein